MTSRGVQYKPILALNGILIDYVDYQIFLIKCAVDLLFLADVYCVSVLFVKLSHPMVI